MSDRIRKSIAVDSNEKFLDFLDDMAFDKHFGRPTFVITIALNSKSADIKNYIHENNVKKLQSVPFSVVYSIFKPKLDELMHFVKSEEIFGTTTAASWTIGFNRGGFPHAYILIYSDKSNTDLDNIINAEIPDPHVDPELHAVIKKYMIHDRSRFDIPSYFCNENEVWPKAFASETCIDLDNIPIYRRRQDGRTLIKNGKTYDNGYVVPYNRRLSLKYQTYVNVELHRQSFWRYTFIKNHYERLSPNNLFYGKWKDLGFPIISRTAEVIRLAVQEEALQSWMQCNTKYDSAKELSYEDFPTKFEFNIDTHEWVPRKDGVVVGRIRCVHRNAGELYYLRILLCKIKGPTSFEDIRTVNGKVYKTFKEACCALGIVDDDEASDI